MVRLIDHHHMIIEYVSSFRNMYNVMVGGVLAMTKQQYLAVNGFSNLYWGWGGEDDDMGNRILTAGQTLINQYV